MIHLKELGEAYAPRVRARSEWPRRAPPSATMSSAGSFIPGLKRYEVKKAVHLEAFCGRLKPKPTGETAEAVKEEEARGILARALCFMTLGMQARCIKFDVAEPEAQPEVCRDHLSEHLWKYATVSMNNAVVALGSLHKFVLEYFERCIYRLDFLCSILASFPCTL